MPEPLWKIRKRKGMTVNQLATKSGVPAISISEYEAGRSIRSGDLPKLARALYVEEWDIEIEGKPLPKPGRTQAPSSAPPPKDRAKAMEPTKAKPARPPVPARPSQIEHLLMLTARHFGKDRAALEKEVGKPLEALTQHEASQLLGQHQKLLSEPRAPEMTGELGVKRKRAYLPESVDEFELEYLTSQQEAGTALRFTLFDGRQLSGTIIGFGPYSITVREDETGEEVTLQKLAIAYYRTARPTKNAGAVGSHPSSTQIGEQP